MWPAARPTSAPLMQPLASAVTVCAVSRSAAVTAANTNFIRILPTRTIAQRDPPERGSDALRVKWKSGTVRDHIGDRLDLAFEDIGEQALKNIARPLRTYRVRLATAEST